MQNMLEGYEVRSLSTAPDYANGQGGLNFQTSKSSCAKMNPSLHKEDSPDSAAFNSSEQLQLNELHEAKIRAVQMEKTMRWWSDCTANWREKWGQVKNERNKARDDIKVLKQRLDDANHEIYQLKRERNEFREGNTQLRKDVEKMAAELRRDRRAFVPPMRIVDGSNMHLSSMVKSQTDATEISQDEKPPKDGSMAALITDAQAFVEITKAHEADKKFLDVEQSLNSAQEQNAVMLDGCKKTREDDSFLSEMKKELESLKEKLQNTESQVTEEIRSKENLSKTVDKLTADIEDLKTSLLDETNAKENAINELNCLKEELEKKENEKANASNDKIPNGNVRVAYSTNSVDRKVKDLRLEIERLQKDNASEWNKREKLETQKLNAERENKKLRHQITDLSNEMKTKVDEITQATDFKLKQVQTELEDKKKELADLKLAHMKLKKVYQDKKEDILHNKTRVDQHEDEIKKLRGRVDELKMKLTTAEDEVDQKENLSRKLQRQLDDQTQQCHVLRVQMEHLQSRCNENDPTWTVWVI
ncbi:coiled-coil domain-containing protein 102A-like isoform X2 [Dendronephthya gigantea]|uniref:coiled-coil domain-containing protein 102A-like isoform X2 n=1 Tax=Dendronephthya gigantea TaxID=151771 RepID=UPI001068FB0B|nr:coiled-coil domain-containing protein 102A-like isoform X2 [Dendronephthya gigantea]